MSVVIVTEKPAVARDIAAVLKLSKREKGCISGKDYRVTWAVGHLVGLAEPHQMNPLWRQWRREDLPLLPDSWSLVVMEQTADQFNTVRELINAPETSLVICATDAGREGELIFRYIYEKAGCQKPVQRLWISSLTPESIQAGLAQLRPAADFDGLAASARARSRADWLVGMNLSRAYSLQTGLNYSVGRVQTPTLALLVDREHEIKNFEVEDYRIIQAEFCDQDRIAYTSQMIDLSESKADGPKGKSPNPKRFKADDPMIDVICQRVRARGEAIVDKLSEKPTRQPPPQFYDLTELQRHANRLYGYSAQKTLDLAQTLYERHKLITYPRTDSRHVAEAMRPTVQDLGERLLERYAADLGGTKTLRSLGKRFIDDAGVSDHHAILPTGKALDGRGLDTDLGRIYDLICRRILTAFLDDFEAMNSEVLLHVPSTHAETAEETVDLFMARGRRVLQVGWKVLEHAKDRGNDGEKELPSALKIGAKQQLVQVKAESRQTLPPARYSEASLLTAMEFAGRKLSNKKLAQAMRDHGLGTPATRSQIIETLIRRDYIQREKRQLVPTAKGLGLISSVHPDIKSPELTGDWEYKLNLICKGQGSLEAFTGDIVSFVRNMTSAAWQVPSSSSLPKAPAKSTAELISPTKDIQDVASLGRFEDSPSTDRSRFVPPLGSLSETLRQRFGFDSFRPHQEAVCQDLVQGRDVLLVMPTGAGKSLCYQLPGLALAGPSLVVSPLIALMDDQVASLKRRGIAAEAIHSGKSRSESQEICRAYAGGRLDFLFVAPERLGVPGFINFLSQHKPRLIAIDEAHCISQWGHDFRYDYRRLSERLAPLRPAVMIALTATATEQVQADIVEQLSLQNPVRHVHGFRRTNIAISAEECRKAERLTTLLEILRDPQRCPAIIYAPTRREAMETADFLKEHVRSAVYHAGIEAGVRNEVQKAFQNDEIDVMVATIAFGMGIDKPNVRTVVHLAVPSTLEGYYQEIGRAGRDGKPSKAVLLYSYGDLKTHEYFLKRNYPDIRELQAIYQQIPSQGIERSYLSTHLPLETVAEHLDRLVMIGALQVYGERIERVENSAWEMKYKAQKDHRQHQLTETHRFVQETHGCRMLRLMTHFGDPDAKGPGCGLCDHCVPDTARPGTTRELTGEERKCLDKLWEYLAIERIPVPSGRLFRDCGEFFGLDRVSFERLLDALVQAQELEVKQASFTKDTEVINYRMLKLANPKPSFEWSTLQVRWKAPKSRRKTQRAGVEATTSRARKGANARPAATSSARQGATALDQPLYENLKAWRKKQADARKLPAYCILSDRTLEQLASEKPKNINGLQTIHGIGPAKLEQFAESLLGILSQA